MNKIIISGRLTKDILLETTKNAKSYCKFTIANNSGYGDYQKTNFVNCICWGKQAETIVKYCSKGSHILIEGTLEQNVWEKDGVKHYDFQINVQSFDFLDKKKSDNPQMIMLSESGEEIPF